MSDDVPNSDSKASKDPAKGKFSPFAGCSIFIIVGVLAIGMIAFTFWIGTRVEETIAGFTEGEPKTIEVTQTQGKESAQVKLKSKLIEFRHHIEAKNKAELTLSAEEMNLAIVTFDILKPQQGNLHITSIGEDGITADISNPINSKMSNIISGEQDYRYLNGQIIITPELVEGAVFPRITAIKPDNGTSVPDEFLQQISKTLMMPFYDDKELGPIYKSLSGVEIKGGLLVLHTDPEYAPKDAPPEDTKPLTNRLMKGFAIIAVVFLAIVTAIIILSRRKGKRDEVSS